MKLISVVTPCFNEEGNVEEMFRQTAAVFDKLPQYAHEHIFIDNASSDGTVEVLRAMAARDPRVKVIVNARNFGHIRSPYHGYMQASGDAVVAIVSDLQEPPALIADLIAKWEQGYKIVVATRKGSQENFVMRALRRSYYRLLNVVSDNALIENFNGFGLYDRSVIEILRTIDDTTPYLRGLVSEIGLPRGEVEFVQARRHRGFTKNNFYTLYDNAMIGLTNHSKVPLRLAAMLGFAAALASLLCGLAYFVYKLLYWDRFSVGIAPLVIGLFFFGSVQLFFLGVVGEYVGAIHAQVFKRPRVIERERINF